MNVLNVVPIIAPEVGGGVAERAIQLARHVGADDVIVKTVSIDLGLESMEAASRSLGNLVLLPTVNRRFGIPQPRFRTLSKLVCDANVIHFSNHWSVLNALVYLINLFYRRPYVVCPAGSLIDGAKSDKLKILYDVVVGKRLLKNAAAVVAIVPREIESFKKYAIEEKNIVVIPNGIPLREVKLEPNVQAHHKPYILFLGRLNKIKGIDLLIEAYLLCLAKDVPDYDLLIAGSDEGEWDALSQRISDRGAEGYIHNVGFVSGARKDLLIAQAGLMVIPSRSEAMSIVVLEAGLLSTPVLCTDKCGLDDFIARDLVKVCSPTAESVAAGLRDFFESDGRVGQAMRLNAIVRQEFGWNAIGSIYEILFSNVQSNKDPFESLTE